MSIGLTQCESAEKSQAYEVIGSCPCLNESVTIDSECHGLDHAAPPSDLSETLRTSIITCCPSVFELHPVNHVGCWCDLWFSS
jgi:hypothetical protein